MPKKYLPSHDEDAELAVIGSIIIEPAWLDDVDLDPDDFYHEQHRILFEAMLKLREKNEHIDELSVSRAVWDDPNIRHGFVQHILSITPTSFDCAYHTQTVKELSRRRKVEVLIEGIEDDLKDANMPTQTVIDKARAALEDISFPSKTSRIVLFSNPRKISSEPPTYLITAASVNDKKAVDIRFTSTELDNATAFKRKIREKLDINPVLPKGFDTLVHTLVKRAKTEFTYKDASADEQVCILIRDWLKTAIKAEQVEDMAQGYIEAESAYWFQSTKLLKYLSEKTKTKLSASSLIAILLPRGLRRMRAGNKQPVFRLGESTVRCWGLDEKFFEAEKEPVEGEQIPLGEKEEEDLSWLEE